jgi:hypothetical protein
MSVRGNDAYRNEDFRKVLAMYDVARAIQEDRRHKSDINRVVSNLPKERSMSVGRYRITVTKRNGSALPAA